MDAKIIGNVLPADAIAFSAADSHAAGADATRFIGVPPPAAAARELPPADHELGPGQALPPPPQYRRPGILSAAAFAAFAAIIAEVGIIVLGPGEPGTTPGSTTGTSTPWSASISLIATGWWTPGPTEPPAAERPAAEPPVVAPRPAAPPAAAPPTAEPPPPPPPELKLWYGNASPDGISAFVSITNNAGKPPVGCVYRAVAVAGPGTMVNYNDVVNFTVSGSAETRIDRPGPETGTTWHATVTCDNGLSTSQDRIY
jgi:hypothetical protein